MDRRDHLEAVFAAVSSGDVEKAVLAALRLSRVVSDYVYASFFLREVYGTDPQHKRIFRDDCQGLSEEYIEKCLKVSAALWMSERTVPFTLPGGGKDDVLHFPVGGILVQVAQMEEAIRDLQVPPGMSQFDTAAFTDSFAQQRSGYRVQVQVSRMILDRIKTNCYNYAVSMEKQLRAQESPDAFLQQVQTTVNNYFKSQSPEVLEKLQKAAGLTATADSEDASLLLVEIRRAIQAVADHFQPPSPEPVVCSDGATRTLSADRYLNRMSEFVAREFPPSTSNDLLAAEWELLDRFVRGLYDLASKGTHSRVSRDEANQGLVGLYLFLFNLIAKIQRSKSDDSE